MNWVELNSVPVGSFFIWHQENTSMWPTVYVKTGVNSEEKNIVSMISCRRFWMDEHALVCSISDKEAEKRVRDYREHKAMEVVKQTVAERYI